MNCNVVKDLIPLYIDECCSDDTAKLVGEHLKECEGCLRVYNEMKCDAELKAPSPAPRKLGRVNEWKASLMQSAALFLSFAAIIIGVSFEASTPAGSANGFWLFALIIPATAFMLSLANLYFVRLYKSGKSFRLASLCITALIAAAAFVWGVLHYGVMGSAKAGTLASHTLWGMAAGAVLTVLVCIAAYLLSGAYAKALGKE